MVVHLKIYNQINQEVRLKSTDSIPPISGIIFDCDGVLVDSTASTIKTVIETATAMGLASDEHISIYLRKIWGASYADIITMLAKKYDWDKDRSTELHQILFSKEEESVPAIAGMPDFLYEMSQAMPIALVSNRRRATAYPLLEEHGLSDIPFCLIQFREDHQFPKPHFQSLLPAIMKMVKMNKGGAHHQRPILVVGDTISHDLAAARLWFNIVAFVGVASGVNTAEEFIQQGVPAEMVIDGIQQTPVRLSQIIESFNGNGRSH